MINEIAILDQAGMKALTTAIGVLGPRLAAAAMKPRGRRAEDLSIARWFETHRITAKFPELEGISDEATERLAEVLGGDETQAALQELLAVRITDGSDADAGRACEVFRLTLSSADPSLSPFAPPLAEFYDDQICDMVGRLEAAEPSMLTQIRSEAMSARMIAILRAIERHTAALSSRPNARSEASFLASYRSHVIEQHGKLEPPDFDRRRRVPIADIYVPPVIYEGIPAERAVVAVQRNPPTLSLWELASRLDRAVLLGDPGGGKTTASNVLMHHFASDDGHRIPFLVTLRNYAASDPPERSVVGFIENQLETLYQCPAPAGLVDMLLLTGRAVVIFDGLDELLDTTRRADVATRVEHFCSEYPQAPVLVTSRVIGYDQARLDEAQFISFQLGGFRDKDVAEYARKWFALDEGARAGDADSFLTESESVPDLRTNPLLLSLMCILYRGEGSLPHNRAEVYEQCAKLLFKRWDAHRHIHQELRAGRYVEPILRHLAWWLFTRDDTRTSVTERELVASTTEFLHGRGFESEDEARDAAQEFIEFSRGRLWVFSDAGTTAAGEKLYAFTHRTFLEYFAASQLAFNCDTPEKLARAIAPHVARGEWEVVGELAVQIKDATSREGAHRVYETLLSERRRRSREGRSNVLQFLARTLRSVTPAPQATRRLARDAVEFMFADEPSLPTSFMPLAEILATSAETSSINQEMSSLIAEMVFSPDHKAHLNGLRLALSLDAAPHTTSSTRNSPIKKWSQQVAKNAETYQAQIIAAAAENAEFACLTLRHGIATVEQVLKMPGGLSPLLQSTPESIFQQGEEIYLLEEVLIAVRGTAREMDPARAREATASLTAVGRHLITSPKPPWVTGYSFDTVYHYQVGTESARNQIMPDPVTYLGVAAAVLISIEASILRISVLSETGECFSSPFDGLNPYIRCRISGNRRRLPDLPVPEEFKQVFRDWAEGKADFTVPAPDSPDQSAW
jgi:hypothetical protein